jgi:uncharacterized protein (DUF58 family)
MPYDPSDLRLPPWLLRLMDLLVRTELRFGAWRLGLTRPGALFLATMLGVSAAAVYSGNNLLYLCGAMFVAFGSAGLISGMRLLRRIPSPSPFMPDHTMAGVGHVLRESVPVPYPFPALVALTWEGNGHTSISLGLRMEQGTVVLSGAMRAERRGIYRLRRLRLETSAPLGLWRLVLVREEGWDWVVVPAPVVVHGGYAAAGQVADMAGDEWRDLRAYVPGDPRSRIHWRKLPAGSADPGQWLVKQFASPPHQDQPSLLRVDMRLPEGAPAAALDGLLAQAVSWLLQPPVREPDARRIVVGSVESGHADPGIWRLLAGATPQTDPPAGQGGLLLSLVGPA